MESRQSEKLSMYLAVISFCNKNIAIIASIPALQISFTSFTKSVVSIKEIAYQTMQINPGFTVHKLQKRKLLTTAAINICNTISAYGNYVNDIELMGKVNFTASQLRRLRECELPIICMNILQALIDNLPAMADYNITQADADNFEALIKEYSDSMAGPRIAITQRSAYVGNLREEFLQADAILKREMDNIITQFETSNPEFYLTYKRNRVIVNAPTRHTKIKGHVINKNTSEPLYGATIVVLENETTVSTDENGMYVVKPIVPATYTLKFSKEGFQSETISDNLVKLGQAATVNVELLPGG